MDVNTTTRKAIVLGSTGLIGTELVEQLIKQDIYSEIRILGRRNVEVNDPKIIFHQVDMDNITEHANLFDVDDVFCCLGTTIKKAGSQAAFKKVDFEMIVNAAKASEEKSKQFLMISSLGANKNSSNFYLKTKGETEAMVMATNIRSIYIFRPSILFGNRKENRTGEKIGIAFMKVLGPVLIGSLKKYRGNHAHSVAKAMILSALSNDTGKHIIESTAIEEMVK